MMNKPERSSEPVNLRGFWIHEGQAIKWEKYINKDGTPNYQEQQAYAAIRACERSRRTVAVDAGAHVGMYTFHLQRYFQQVHSFEPAPECFACLKLNFEKRANVTLYNNGLSNGNGWLSMAPRKMGWEVVPFGLAKKQIPCRSLDSLNLPDLALFKLDVEGHEFEVLEGAERTIKEYKPVIILEHKAEMVGEKPVFQFLEGLGMKKLNRYKHDYLFVWG